MNAAKAPGPKGRVDFDDAILPVYKSNINSKTHKKGMH